MERSRSPSRPLPVNGKPTSLSPTPRARMPSPRGRSTHRYGSSTSRSTSASSFRSRSRSRDRSPSRRHHHHERHTHQEPRHEHHEHHHGLFKTSASLIAGIGLATMLAHKAWPKGFPHGEMDDWQAGPNSRHISKPHHHHHHHHHHSDRDHDHDHVEHRHHRSSSVSERVVSRSSSVQAHRVAFVDEAPTYAQDTRRMSLDPRAVEFERREVRSGRYTERSRPAVLPYPETPYPSEKFYDPRGRRASISTTYAVR